ncbi:GntR family transcriptional regulator [Caproiciproducens sp. NJN-50]|uniref:GntR family transcriptional regulator n=1 Tax=Acutalibacteraceae TaxID=3082771 RepID=UPI000FFE1B48|nr:MULTISPECIES: GntR family transcriptional regulator [Acutalibacteraceae]QAT51030.1 GntR family transcriptional regulator [Caproiciproducens sp. NJN-50]
MPPDFSNDKPIFQQIAEELEDAILSGAFREEEQIPSTTEISVNYKINPATALKGINLLVEESVAYKRRGVGMFVSPGAKQRIQEKRRQSFFRAFVLPLVREAGKLGLGPEDTAELIKRGFKDAN